MSRVVALSRTGAAAAALLLAGCAVGPDYKTPTAPDGAGYSAKPLPDKTAATDIHGGEAQSYIRDLDIPGQWWTLFHSPALNALVERALRNNHDLTAAQAALRNAQENLKSEQASVFFPTITGNYTPSRQKNATNTLAPTLTDNQPYFTLHQVQLTLSYTLDVFGSERRQIESLLAQSEQQRFEAEATYLTLTSNLVSAAIQEASLRAQIAATERLVAIETQLTDLARRERTLGQYADADVLLQEAVLANTEATLPPLKKQLDIQRDLITALCGVLPTEEAAEIFELDSLTLPTELPVSLPSKLLDQRPDVQAAGENLHAATAQVGVALANILPNFSISASTGSAATTLGQLFTPGNGFWTLAGSVDQTIFDGGALLHKRRAADAAMDQAAEQYKSTVVAAFQNVADTLHTIQSDADTLVAQVAAERASEKSLDLTRKQAGLGAVGEVAVLNAELTFRQALAARVQAQAARFADTVSLFQALGGGWWNRSDLEPPKDEAAAATPQP